MHLNTGNLPVVAKCAVTETEKREIGSYLPSCLSFSDRNLDLFGNWNVNALPCDVDAEYAHYSRIMCPCVADEANVNLSGPQKELLLWHWKLGDSMYQVQELMREQKFEEKTGVETVLPPVIPSKFATTSSCPIPKCTACQLATMRKRNPQVVKQLPIPEKEGILSWNKYEPGDFVSSDQFVVKTPGRLLIGYGREGAEHRFHGGTIFNDAASGVIWVEPQVSLGAGEIVMSKVRFEEWLWEQAAAEVSHFHSDNGVLTADLFREDCKRKGQSQSFSGVGAQHQNARAERAIQTIMYHARTFMIHTSLHWSEYGADDLCLWSFAVKHAAWLYNRLPNRKSGLTPFELLTRTKANHCDLLSTLLDILSFKMERNYQSGIVVLGWVSFLVSVMSTLLLLQMFAIYALEVWLSEPERRDQKEKLIQQSRRQEECDRICWIELTPDTPDNNDPAPPLVSDNVSSSSDESSIETMSASGGSGGNDNNDNDNVMDGMTLQREPMKNNLLLEIIASGLVLVVGCSGGHNMHVPLDQNKYLQWHNVRMLVARD
eukprot:g5374.t1 g5374   contig2:418133-419951(-)